MKSEKAKVCLILCQVKGLGNFLIMCTTDKKIKIKIKEYLNKISFRMKDEQTASLLKEMPHLTYFECLLDDTFILMQGYIVSFKFNIISALQMLYGGLD